MRRASSYSGAILRSPAISIRFILTTPNSLSIRISSRASFRRITSWYLIPIVVVSR